MIKNYFRIAVRNILKHKVFSLLNVSGLAIGLAASLLILIWVQDELSYDKFNVNAKNIYRVEEDQFYAGKRYHVTVTPHPSGPVWKTKIPEIVEQTRVNRLSRILFRQGDKLFFESSVVAADSGLFRMFSIPLISGDQISPLSAPHSIVLSEKLAGKYFGNTNPIGKTLILETKMEFTVTAIMKNLPHNSTLNFEAVIPYSFLKEIGAISDSWGNNSILTFIQLAKGSDLLSVNKKLTDVVLEFHPTTTTKFSVFPLLDIHLHSQFGYTETKGPVIAVYIFSLIAIFIIIIACINFINLSTAKASLRSKEIGIKKASGAGRLSIILQFLFESLFLAVIAMIFSFLLVCLSLKTFNAVSGKNFVLNDLFTIRFLLNFLFVGLIAGFVSGIYPAFYLSSFKPVAVLKGEVVSGKGNIRMRQILVVFQFAMSILIAIVAVNMFLQLKYLQNKELGFDKENIICIPMAEGMKTKYYSLKNELRKEPVVLGVTAARSNPVMIGSNSGGAVWDGKDPDKQVLIGTNAVDYDYFSTMKMEIVAGRDFSTEFPSDFAKDTLGNFLVNEEVVKIMGVAEPVGKNFSFMGIHGKIVGVLKNFYFQGADQQFEPIAFALTEPKYLSVILIRIAGGNITESLKTVEKRWKEVMPEYPLNYTFIDNDYDGLYRAQTRFASLLKYFTILTVIIACLGLYGLALYSAERRTNEVGIRKVMGANSVIVIYELSKEFIILVLISIIIALPAGWLIVGSLLKQFANRITMNVAVFAAIAAAAVIVALFTVVFQAYKAASTNPAEALKIE